MWPTTKLQDLLSIEHPIIQAPMGGAVDFALVTAVAKSGGLGSLPCAAATPIVLNKILERAKDVVDLSININFFAHETTNNDAKRDASWLASLAPYYKEYDCQQPASLDPGSLTPFDEERCSIIEKLPPKVVSFHFGLPHDCLVERVKRTGAKVMSSATTVEEAVWLEKNGCDIIIAQGFEAGGHRGMFLTKDLSEQIGTFALVPQIVDAVSIPVIAAGGIGDGRGIAASLALGAVGVQIGSAYLFTREATIDEHYRRALSSENNANTVVTNVISGRPTRIARTRLTEDLGPISLSAAEFPRGFAAIDPLERRALTRGRTDFCAHYFGQATPLGHPTSAEDLTQELVVQTQTVLEELSS